MTREEAIRVLEDNRPSVIFEDKDAQKRMAELCQAIDMAIDALKGDDEDEPQFYTEDDYWNGMFAESAEAYKAWTGEEMGVYVKGVKYPRDCNECWLAFPNNDWDFTSHCRVLGEDCPNDGKLQNCPLVDRPHGEWINVSGCWEANEKCSVCGEIVYEYNYNYCPNCGARMKGGDGDGE